MCVWSGGRVATVFLWNVLLKVKHLHILLESHNIIGLVQKAIASIVCMCVWRGGGGATVCLYNVLLELKHLHILLESYDIIGLFKKVVVHVFQVV